MYRGRIFSKTFISAGVHVLTKNRLSLLQKNHDELFPLASLVDMTRSDVVDGRRRLELTWRLARSVSSADA